MGRPLVRAVALTGVFVAIQVVLIATARVRWQGRVVPVVEVRGSILPIVVVVAFCLMLSLQLRAAVNVVPCVVGTKHITEIFATLVVGLVAHWSA